MRSAGVGDPGAPPPLDRRARRARLGRRPVGLMPSCTFVLNRQRKSGGALGPLRDWVLGRDEWFALYRDDGSVDDATFVQSVARGQFRLHPLGPRRMSTGCIVLNDQAQFDLLRKYLVSNPATMVPGTSLRTYGRMEVALPAGDTRVPRGNPPETRVA